MSDPREFQYLVKNYIPDFVYVVLKRLQQREIHPLYHRVRSRQRHLLPSQLQRRQLQDICKSYGGDHQMAEE